jgi:hypothetical protein
MPAWAALAALSFLLFAPPEQEWKNKPPSDWTEADANLVLADSPWSKTATAALDKEYPHKPGIKIGDLTIPDVLHRSAVAKPAASGRPPVLTLRWEGARPVREANRKVDKNAVNPDPKYYAIAVYGLPKEALAGDEKDVAGRLQKQAVLKRYAKKEIAPVRVQILFRDEGPIVLYLFAKPGDITWRDHNLEFDAQAAQWKFTQSFSLDDMMFEGNLEL